jgi:hypothetical protein
VWSVSVREGEHINERVEERKKVTVLFCKAEARCCAPSSPIRLSARSSAMTAY